MQTHTIDYYPEECLWCKTPTYKHGILGWVVWRGFYTCADCKQLSEPQQQEVLRRKLEESL